MRINAYFPETTAFFLLLSFFILCFDLSLIHGQSTADSWEVGIEEHLGEFLPQDLTFATENGDSVTLAELIDKPTILAFIYYDCPGICTPLLNGLVDVLQKLDGVPGRDYGVVTISINESDKAPMAAQKKKNALASFRGAFPAEAWHFLTGSQSQVEKVTQAIGFHFRRVGEDVAHPGLLTVLAHDGQIIRYLFGIQFNQFDLKMALIEALEGRPGPTIAKVLEYCFSYDPEGRKYAFNMIKVSGTVVLFVVLIFVGYLIKISRTRRTQVEVR